jgi:hypothetical protein
MRLRAVGGLMVAKELETVKKVLETGFYKGVIVFV